MLGESLQKNEGEEETKKEEQQKQPTEHFEQQHEQKHFGKKQKSRLRWRQSHGQRTSW